MQEDFALRYSHNIIEHLGLKLYQNQPTRVIAELVSNSWDADAVDIHINTQTNDPRWVSVYDNGHGMDRERLTKGYLVIGHAKRSKPDERSPNGRPVMGRKGIGKLAAFGIAKKVDLITAAKTDDGIKFVWLRFNRDELLGKGDGRVTYHPEILADGISCDQLPLDQDLTGQVSSWLKFIAQGTGTLVLMTNLSIVKALNDGQLLESLGSRFTILTGGLVNIYVNSVTASNGNALPGLEFRIPAEGKTTLNLPDGREIKYWVGFVKSADWPQDLAGVGVYAHGKIAQDRPFFFGVKGREIWTRYMLAFVEADWLDELSADLISTDRTSVNWDAPEVSAFYAKGQELTRDWVNKFANWRKEQETAINRTLVHAAMNKGDVSRVTDAEEEEIVRLVSTITPSFDKHDDDAKRRLVSAVSDAWVQKPMRKLIKDLWNSLSDEGEVPARAFAAVVERLSSHSVPESLNLAVIFGQRAFALSRLHDYVYNGIETDLQKLLEHFPWIIEPDSTVLSANESLKTVAQRACEMGQIPGLNPLSDVGGTTIRDRPDFVFLSSPKEHEIVIIELKNPQLDLTVENIAQLHGYMLWVQSHHPTSTVKGYLVGKNPANLISNYRGVEVVPWVDVLHRSKARNLELLAAMLLRTGSDGALDARSMDAVELGGADAKQYLEKLAADHPEIKALMEKFKQPAPKG